jgi:hypothetical protein
MLPETHMEYANLYNPGMIVDTEQTHLENMPVRCVSHQVPNKAKPPGIDEGITCKKPLCQLFNCRLLRNKNEE